MGSGERKVCTRTVLGKHAGMAVCPCLVLRKAVVEEDLEEREEFVVLCGDDGVEAE